MYGVSLWKDYLTFIEQKLINEKSDFYILKYNTWKVACLWGLCNKWDKINFSILQLDCCSYLDACLLSISFSCIFIKIAAILWEHSKVFFNPENDRFVLFSSPNVCVILLFLKNFYFVKKTWKDSTTNPRRKNSIAFSNFWKVHGELLYWNYYV